MIKKHCIIAVTLLSLSAKEMFTGLILNTKRMTGIPAPVVKETRYYSSHPVISVSKGMFTGPILNTKRVTRIPAPVDKETMYYSSHPVISVSKGNIHWASTEYQENDWDTRT